MDDDVKEKDSSFNDLLDKLIDKTKKPSLDKKETNDEFEEFMNRKIEFSNETNNNESKKEKTDDNKEQPIQNNEIEDITEETSDIKKEKSNRVIKFFNDKRIYTILIISIFVLSCTLVGKTFYLRNKVDNYEELIITVEKDSNEINVYSEEKNNIDNLQKGAASELINCINSPVDINNLPKELNDVIEEIHNYYNSSNEYFAFVYKDIFTGFTVGYNENQNIFTASAIKGPTDIYIYEMASKGKVNLDEELTYTSSYYNTGSGLLKNKDLNTKYTVRKLLEYSTVYSDNAAHNMLTDRFGRENMYNFWKEKGTTAIFSQNSNWGVLNAKDSSIYMSELYDFYTRDDVYGKAIMTNFINAIPKFISSENNYVIANKSGWSGSVLHDIAIVFADNPYIVVALSNTGASGNYMEYFNSASKLAYKLHSEYWKYKVSTCENIKQY